MTTEYFCLFCGIKTEGNTIYHGKGGYLNCSCCNGRFNFDIDQRPTKTEEEIEKAFQDTPLTDSQRGRKRKGNAAKL